MVSIWQYALAFMEHKRLLVWYLFHHEANSVLPSFLRRWSSQTDSAQLVAPVKGKAVVDLISELRLDKQTLAVRAHEFIFAETFDVHKMLDVLHTPLHCLSKIDFGRALHITELPYRKSSKNGIKSNYPARQVSELG